MIKDVAFAASFFATLVHIVSKAMKNALLRKFFCFVVESGGRI